jgi:hypothetical protein
MLPCRSFSTLPQPRHALYPDRDVDCQEAIETGGGPALILRKLEKTKKGH